MSILRQTGVVAFALATFFIGIAASSNAEQFAIPLPDPGKPRPFKSITPFPISPFTLQFQPPIPLPNAHAHNDYEHKRPLFDALDNGFCSVEADVFLEKGQLLVAHTRLDLRPERTLEKLYLDPLRERIKANGGRVYKGGPPIWLLVDVKTEAISTYEALDKVFAKYGDILSVVKDGKFDEKAVTVVISGNRAKDVIAAQTTRYAGIDGRVSDLDSSAPAHLIPWISESFATLFKWRGEGPMPEDERARMKDITTKAHAKSRLVRFWATPEKVEVWRELRAAGVDLLNTDKLSMLRDFLLAQPEPKKQAAGDTDWIDPDTGHRVIRLSQEPGTSSFYFHQQSYTEKGDKLIVSTKGGFAAIDLTTLGVSPPKIEQIVKGKGGSAIVGKKTRQLFYYRGNSIFATNIDTKETREVAKLPKGYTGASGLAINADETLLASTGDDPVAKTKAGADIVKSEFTPPPTGPKGKMTPGGRSKVLFTVNIATGAVQPVHYSTEWLNHTQFSPTEPGQLLFCHEGTWDLVNRIWTIRADGAGLKLMHPRTMLNEIAGHEFFSSDGQMVWYDLQTPRSTQFWLAGVDIKTGTRIRYPIERAQWSVHYNQSHDGKRFAGDGGGPGSVANRPPKGGTLDGPGNGQWIYLFTPRNDKWETLNVGGEEVKIGALNAEKLVNMAKHDYRVEPNVTFTPDDKWIVFRSNMQGGTHVYAVEVRKSR